MKNNCNPTVFMGDSTPSSTHWKYALPHDLIEQTRLSSQYKFMKKVLDHERAVPALVDMSQISNVLDVAAGTIVWVYDLLCDPAVKARTQDSSKNPIHLYACDITDVKFPPKEELESLGITAFLQDLTEPFPDDMKEKFDLVHLSFVRFSFNQEGWNRAIKNLSEVLKPGGLAFILETDNIFYGANQPPPGKESRHDIESSMKGQSWIHKLNTIYTKAARRNDYIPDPSYRLESLLNSAGLSVIAFERNFTPFGKLCQSYKGLKGSDLSHAEEFSTENLRLITEALVKDQISKGILEAPSGHIISTEEESTALINEIVKGSREEGVSLILSAFLAKKDA